jgi:hypothetical protein
MITKHMLKVWAKDSHVLATIGWQSSIGKLHRHVDQFPVMRCFATREDANVFPREPWVPSLVMDMQTAIAVPVQFGKEGLVFHLFCHAFQAT